MIETKPFQPSIRSSGHPDSATVSTPGTVRKWSATWSQYTGDCARCVTVSSVRIRSAEKPVGLPDNRSNVAANKPATNSTRKQNATCTQISPCISRRRECGSSPPFNAIAGFTPEARSAGARPNSSVTPSVSASPKPSTRQSAGSDSRAGLSAGLIRLTTNGADHHANNPPAAPASSATVMLSTSTSCTSRHRPAPIDTRSAISRARAAACAVIRFATLAHAINSTSPTSTPRATSARR